jgi:peptide/nickel transport system ATP-binding protein
MVFQNPYASLNPRARVDQLVSEGAVYHGIVSKKDASSYVGDLLRQVGLDPTYANRYPHQFSGGQRQRIAIARALALNPRFIVCDEAVSALDVSVQAQILNLFMDLRESKGLTYLFISHNLAVVEYIADRVAIMYLGRIVELTDTKTIFQSPNHPYTKALIADAPRLDSKAAEHRPIQGELPSPLNPPSGCSFHPRCPHATERCKTERPPLREIAPMHFSACHLNDPVVLS